MLWQEGLQAAGGGENEEAVKETHLQIRLTEWEASESLTLTNGLKTMFQLNKCK